MHGLVDTPPSTIRSGLISTNILNNSWKVKNILEKILLWFNKEVFKASNLLCYLQLYNKTLCKLILLWAAWVPVELTETWAWKREVVYYVAPAWRRNTQVSCKHAGWGVKEQPGLENGAWKGMWCSEKVCDRQVKINLQAFQDLQANLNWRLVLRKGGID